MTSLQLAVLALIPLVLAGCGAEPVRSSVPTAPSPTPPVPTPPVSIPTARQPSPWPPGVFTPNITLAGVVFEVVHDEEVPIEGAWVYCELCTQETHAGMYTDNKGVYSFKGVWVGDDAFWISARKDGYRDPPDTADWPGYREVTINGDTRFSIQLARK